MENKNRLTISSSPHIRSNETVQSVMRDVIIALIPAAIGSIYFFKVGAVINIIAGVVADDLDYETGIVFEKKVGDSVQKGEIVAKVYTNGKISSELVTEFQKYIKINDGVQSLREIIEIIS